METWNSSCSWNSSSLRAWRGDEFESKDCPLPWWEPCQPWAGVQEPAAPATVLSLPPVTLLALMTPGHELRGSNGGSVGLVSSQPLPDTSSPNHPKGLSRKAWTGWRHGFLGPKGENWGSGGLLGGLVVVNSPQGSGLPWEIGGIPWTQPESSSHPMGSLRKGGCLMHPSSGRLLIPLFCLAGAAWEAWLGGATRTCGYLCK